MSVDSRRRGITAAVYIYIYIYMLEYNITGHVLSVRERALARTHARERPMRDQSYLAEKGAYPSRPKRRLFSAYLSVRNARVAALPETLRENGRGTTARVCRVSMKESREQRDSTIARTVTPLRLCEIILETSSER